jgi:RNase P/RNase MRP subunit POP5
MNDDNLSRTTRQHVVNTRRQTPFLNRGVVSCCRVDLCRGPERLAAALKAFRHLRGRRVLLQSTGDPLTMKTVRTESPMPHAERACGLACTSSDTRSVRISR